MSVLLVPPPPYMLGERPTPLHGGSGRPTFRQVPFVRVSERVESGVKVRKQLRKYLKASSATQHVVAQMHLSDACITSMQPQEIAQSCFESFFAHMRHYNETVGQKHLEASKAYLEMTKPLDNSGKSRKWARDVYNQVQKCVQEVNLAERKMEKAKQRKERAEEELMHWKRVLEANEATYQVQPNNPEVIRAYQLAQYRFSNAFADDEASTYEYEDARNALYSSIERRDQVVEEATELSQSMEEDRLDTMLIVMNQFVETKVAILQAEFEAMSRMQKLLRDMERDSVIQQYVVDSMQPQLTHRHAKALFLLEWHRQWHYEQQTAQANEPANYLTLSPDDVIKVKNAGISLNDVDVIKDFVASCFMDPDSLLQTGKAISTRHRNRFADPASLSMYRMEVVRNVILNCLNQQRTHSLELSKTGYEQLAAALRLLLDACSEREDNKTVKKVMNMIQTFYRTGNAEEQKVYLHASLIDHPLWSFPQYWGNALLLSVGEELSKNPQETPWHILPSQERTQLVLGVHNIVFGQVTSFIYHMATFGFSRKQIFQYAQNVCFAYELAEDQRIALFSSVQSLQLEDKEPRREVDSEEEVHFTSLTLSDWTSACGGVNSGQKFRPFLRSRTQSTISDAVTSRTLEGSIISMASSNGTSMSGVRDLEEMKSLASASTVKTYAVEEESWEDLFGASGGSSGGIGGSASGSAGGSVIASNEDDAAVNAHEPEGEKQKRMKKRKNSRKFNDQLRLARSLPLSYRIKEEDQDETSPPPLPPQEKLSASSGASSNGGSQKVVKSAANSQIQMREDRSASAAAYKEPREASVSRRSVDDGMVATEHPVMERKRSSKRLSKSRSAASIDTSSLNDPFIEYTHPPPRVDTQDLAPPPLPPAPTSAPKSGGSGMDQIKSIAAQMKLRRKTSEKAMLVDLGELVDEKTLRRTPSGTGSTFEGGSSSRSNGQISEQPIPASAIIAQEAAEGGGGRPSGVAALRARFEKI
ncbi:hypothetical protein Gpo141_00005658 [Globisporangium polare]